VISVREVAYGSADFDACMALRIEVFVHEQNVPEEEERDELDPVARHFLAQQDGVPVGTLRLVGKSPDVTKITRVAVRRAARGQGIGVALMQAAEAAAATGILALDAQTHALRFYERLGYAPEGAEFMEAGIPHLHMTKRRI
jgi:predicted GNAT family N-acyltransferase